MRSISFDWCLVILEFVFIYVVTIIFDIIFILEVVFIFDVVFINEHSQNDGILDNMIFSHLEPRVDKIESNFKIDTKDVKFNLNQYPF